MTHQIIVLLILACSCAVSLDLQSHPGAILPKLSAMGKVDELTHHFSKRQTSDLSNLADCVDIRVEHECGPSGYSQQLVDIALSCRNETYARDIANACARSENGDLCVSASSRFFEEQRYEEGASNCSLTVLSGLESCPSACRSFLESARNTLGCCINTYINTTVNPLSLYSDYVDYRLWNLCNVPLPAADCGNGLPLNPPQNAEDCTFQELTSRIANHACSPSVGQPLVDALLQNSKCQSLARVIVDYCSTNANNEYCAAVIGSDISESVTSNVDPLLGSLISDCEFESSAIIICNSSCQSAITNIANSYGCCVNIFNDSNSIIFNFQLPQLSYGVWNLCGVESPGFCTSTLRSTLSSATQIVRGFAGWMIAVVAMATHMILHQL